MIMQPQCTYHLAGMNVEAWEHKHPEEGDSPCTEAVWKMVCHTYFPRAQTGCKTNPPEPTKLLRPCKNVCQSYVKACQVQCCDESVACVDSSKVSLVDGTEIENRRYHEESGPSHLCTGAASRQSPGVSARSWQSWHCFSSRSQDPAERVCLQLVEQSRHP